MNEQLSKEIEAKSKAHITNLTCYKIASVIENFAIRSFSLFVKIFEDMSLVNIVINLIKLIIRMPLVIVIYCAVATLLGANLNLIAILITYIAFYLVIFGVARFFRTKFEDTLFALQNKCRKDLEKYFVEQALIYNIKRSEMCDTIAFENGITVTNVGDITAHTSERAVDLKANNFEKTGYLCPKTDQQDMSKNIASLEFNKKFSMVVAKSLERDCMKFLTPSLQLQMIKSPVLNDCEYFGIRNQRFYGRYSSMVSRPMVINLFEYKSVGSYYTDVEFYCEEFADFAKAISDDLIKINF